jgi:hypothetical protein
MSKECAREAVVFFCGAAAGLRQHDVSEKGAAACKPAPACFLRADFFKAECKVLIC